MFWDDLSANRRRGVAQAAPEPSPAVPAGEVSQPGPPDPSTGGHGGSGALPSPLILGVLLSPFYPVKLGHGPAEPSPEHSLPPLPLSSPPAPCVGSPPARRWRIRGHGPAAMAALMLASESIKPSGKVQSLRRLSRHAPKGPGGVRGGDTDPESTGSGETMPGAAGTPPFHDSIQADGSGVRGHLGLRCHPHRLWEPGGPRGDRTLRGEQPQVKDRSIEDMPAPVQGDGRTELAHGLGSSSPSGAQSGDRRYGTAHPVLFPAGMGMGSHHTQPKFPGQTQKPNPASPQGPVGLGICLPTCFSFWPWNLHCTGQQAGTQWDSHGGGVWQCPGPANLVPDAG